jgi:SAM-dependent methyltransferase
VARRPAICIVLLVSACAGAGRTRPGADASLDPTAGLPEYGPPELERDLEATRRLIVDLVDARPGMVVADIGSSYGYYIDALAPALGPDGRYFATDIDPRVVEHLHRYETIVPILVPRLARAPRDTALDDLAPESVDLILMIDSVVFSRPADEAEERTDIEYLRRLARILRRSGRLIHRVAWLSEGHRTREQVVSIFRTAGFSGATDDVAVPDHVPAVFRAPDGTVARRGFLLVFRR